MRPLRDAAHVQYDKRRAGSKGAVVIPPKTTFRLWRTGSRVYANNGRGENHLLHRDTAPLPFPFSHQRSPAMDAIDPESRVYIQPKKRGASIINRDQFNAALDNAGRHQWEPDAREAFFFGIVIGVMAMFVVCMIAFIVAMGWA